LLREVNNTGQTAIHEEKYSEYLWRVLASLHKPSRRKKHLERRVKSIISQLADCAYSYRSAVEFRSNSLSPGPAADCLGARDNWRRAKQKTAERLISVPLASSAARRHFEAKLAHGDLQVHPCLLFLAGIAQKERGVIGDDKLAAADGVDAPAESSKRLALAEQIG
jgi:hypothetical protein